MQSSLCDPSTVAAPRQGLKDPTAESPGEKTCKKENETTKGPLPVLNAAAPTGTPLLQGFLCQWCHVGRQGTDLPLLQGSAGVSLAAIQDQGNVLGEDGFCSFNLRIIVAYCAAGHTLTVTFCKCTYRHFSNVRTVGR